MANAQRVRVDTSAAISTWTYFDGLGRTYLARKTAPESKIVATQTKYNANGTVSQTSLPYFDGTETLRFTSFIYDDLGRAISATNPDTSTALSCFESGAGVVVTIDPDGNRKRQTRDALGRLVKIVDAVQGNSDVGGITVPGELGGQGVVSSTSGVVSPPAAPYLYRTEILAENTTNPRENSRMSVLYAY